MVAIFVVLLLIVQHSANLPLPASYLRPASISSYQGYESGYSTSGATADNSLHSYASSYVEPRSSYARPAETSYARPAELIEPPAYISPPASTSYQRPAEVVEPPVPSYQQPSPSYERPAEIPVAPPAPNYPSEPYPSAPSYQQPPDIVQPPPPPTYERPTEVVQPPPIRSYGTGYQRPIEVAPPAPSYVQPSYSSPSQIRVPAVHAPFSGYPQSAATYVRPASAYRNS